MIRHTNHSGVLPFLLVAIIVSTAPMAASRQKPAADVAVPHIVSFVSGDVVAEPQTLSGSVSGGKADLSGTIRATYNFDKWIANANQGDPSVYEILKRAQVAAGGVLTGYAQIKVDASAVVNSFITVVVDVGGESYTIKLYTCVDHRKTTVTDTPSEILVSQIEGTACAYQVPRYVFSNEGEDLVYRIKK